jgi:hypothetical protein
MVMSDPPPINYKTNPHYNPSKADYDYTSPLSPSGSIYPCKGHLKDLNAPEGQSVRNYSPGGEYDLKYINLLFIQGYIFFSGGRYKSLTRGVGAGWRERLAGSFR